MPGVDSLVKDFLAQKKIAVVGVSDKRETGCNSNYSNLKRAGYQVFTVNPHITAFAANPAIPICVPCPRNPTASSYLPMRK